MPDTDRISINDIKKLQVKNGNGELMFVEGLVEIEDLQCTISYYAS